MDMDMDTVFKAFSVVSKTVDLDLGIFEGMISTEAVDRQGDIVRATGARLENYLLNPVVLWAHNYSELPVARAISIEIIAGVGLKARFQFPEWGTSAKADEVRRLWAAGFLNATSIGFNPVSSKPLDPKQMWGAQDYVEWELLEFSIVPVPANQEALRLAMKTLSTPIEKRGRVLSAGNEKKIRQASEYLQEVLDQLQEEADPGEETPDKQNGKAEPTIDDDTEQRSEAIAESLSNLFDVLLKENKK